MITLSDACEAYLADARARRLRDGTLLRYRLTLRQLCEYAASRGVSDIAEVDRALLRDWRQSWAGLPSTQSLRIQIVKAFFRFAVTEQWIEKTPAAGLRPPKQSSIPPTMPLALDEMQRLVGAAGERSRERALILLMRYSGLAIRDATTLPRTALDGQILSLRRAKSGELVLCELPARVATELAAVAPGRRHYFWTGQSRPTTVTSYWRARLATVAERAGIENFHTHRLRDTFAVNLLIAGVAIKDVSTLLGHSSVLTTEKYYAPWDISRRDHLVRVLRSANAECHLLAHLYGPGSDANQDEMAAGRSDLGLASPRVSPLRGPVDTGHSTGWR